MERQKSRSLADLQSASRHAQQFWQGLESGRGGSGLPALPAAAGSPPGGGSGGLSPSSGSQEGPPAVRQPAITRSCSLPPLRRAGTPVPWSRPAGAAGASPPCRAALARTGSHSFTAGARRQSTQQHSHSGGSGGGTHSRPAVLRTASMFAPATRGSGDDAARPEGSMGSMEGSRQRLSLEQPQLSTLYDDGGEEEEVLAAGGEGGQPLPSWEQGAGAGSEGSMIWKGLEDFGSLSTISRGAAHAVYVAQPRQSEEAVVIKAFLKAGLSGRSALRHFQRERHLLATLRHDNIVRGLGAFEDEAAHYIVQEYIDGRSVRQYLGYWLQRQQSRPPVPPAPVVPEGEVVELVVRPLLGALEYLHCQGITHRDVKPENLVFTRQGCIKLLDFGLASDTRVDTRPSSMVGTLMYMAPENFGLEPLEASLLGRTDVWGAGVITYQLLCGRLPFFHDSRNVLHQMVAECEVPFEGLEAVGASELAINFVRQALTKDPGLRPTAAELLLHRWITG